MATGQQEAESAIRALSDAFVRYFNAGDADELVQSFYADDARVLPPNQPMVSGRSQVREAFREFFGGLQRALHRNHRDGQLRRPRLHYRGVLPG
jgi:ketosteroid isomerase-like protein